MKQKNKNAFKHVLFYFEVWYPFCSKNICCDPRGKKMTCCMYIIIYAQMFTLAWLILHVVEKCRYICSSWSFELFCRFILRGGRGFFSWSSFGCWVIFLSTLSAVTPNLRQRGCLVPTFIHLISDGGVFQLLRWDQHIDFHWSTDDMQLWISIPPKDVSSQVDPRIDHINL